MFVGIVLFVHLLPACCCAGLAALVVMVDFVTQTTIACYLDRSQSADSLSP